MKKPLGNRHTILARWARYFKGMLNMEECVSPQQREERNDGKRVRRTKRKNHQIEKK
jgi:hypothetical protein